MLTLGLDLGTSGVKAVLVGADDAILGQASAPLTIQYPQPRQVEQSPEDWWQATLAVLDQLAREQPAEMARVAAIGLSGQMLGVVLLDAADAVLRPALLWNDGRAEAECRALDLQVTDFAGRTGTRPMPGFPAPKLLWLARHEPALLARTRRILLPKDYLRLRLSGTFAGEMSDSSATLLMDTMGAGYDPEILAACGISTGQLPPVSASTAPGGLLRDDLVRRWGMAKRIPVVGGAGDNMAGAVGARVVAAGDAFISLGTSAVYLVANDRFVASRDRGMHTHRHAVEGVFVQQGCVLSAAAALAWVVAITGGGDIGTLVGALDQAPLPLAQTPIFTPYLAGERTPHDNAGLTATFSGLTLSTERRHLVQGVMEGVALALGDCDAALCSNGASVGRVQLVGGGARSTFWARLIASATGRVLEVSADAAVGPALGAARLARAGLGGPLLAPAKGPVRHVEPEPDLAEALQAKRAAYVAHLRLG